MTEEQRTPTKSADLEQEGTSVKSAPAPVETTEVVAQVSEEAQEVPSPDGQDLAVEQKKRDRDAYLRKCNEVAQLKKELDNVKNPPQPSGVDLLKKKLADGTLDPDDPVALAQFNEQHILPKVYQIANELVVKGKYAQEIENDPKYAGIDMDDPDVIAAYSQLHSFYKSKGIRANPLKKAIHLVHPELDEDGSKEERMEAERIVKSQGTLEKVTKAQPPEKPKQDVLPIDHPDWFKVYVAQNHPSISK